MSTLANWKSYEFNSQTDYYHPVRLESNGGPKGRPCIWADDTMWSIDTPENPVSILPLLVFRNWTNKAPVDLRNAEITFHLRGDDLELKGANCYFWVSGYTPRTTRWHYIDQPVDIPDGKWDTPVTLILRNNPNLWHRSFSSDSQHPSPLNHTLGASISYGFSFVGFSEKVTGRIGLSSFFIKTDKHAAWTFAADLENNADDWLTVSRSQRMQIPIPHSQFVENTSRDSAHRIKKKILYIDNDFLNVQNEVPFSYFGFIRNSASTAGADLRDALLIIIQLYKDLDIKGGSLHFFVEHSPSNTRWIFKEALHHVKNCRILYRDLNHWHRISGSAALDDVLAGSSGKSGYDYFGIMACNVKEPPSGIWALEHFSLGPVIETHKAGVSHGY